MTDSSTSSSAINDFYDYEDPVTQDDEEYLSKASLEVSIFFHLVNI